MVSIVIPTCDRAEILRRCLDSLSRQTWKNIEIIVVDDFSADATPAVLQTFAAANPLVAFRALRNDRHCGANPSRNRGIQAATGDLIAFLDSDCIAQPEWIERLIAPFSDEGIGAVTGRVDEPPPTNLYELTFRGTNRIDQAGPAHRLVAGNLCVRRRLLLERPLDEDRASPQAGRDGRPDTTVSGRGDEEGLFLHLRAAGWRMLVVPDAIVLHIHPLSGRAFFRQAFRGGRAAARLVYKYHLPPRIDMLPFLLAYATLPLCLLPTWGWAVPTLFAIAAVAAIEYNDVVRKRKTIGQALLTLPLLLAYYHVRLSGYVLESIRLRVFRNPIRRVRLGRAGAS